MPSAGPTNEVSLCSRRWPQSIRAVTAFLGSNKSDASPSASAIHVSLANPDSLYIKGLAHYQKGEYAEAERIFNAVIQLKWQFPVAHLLLGNIAAENKNYSAALDRYVTVLEIDPYEPTAYYNIALTYADLTDLPNQRLWLEKALTISPGYAPAYFELAKLLCSINQTRRAIALLIKSAYQDPLNPDALVQAGRLYYDSTFSRNAITCYQRALNIDPWHQKAHLHLGMAHFRDGQCGLAILAFAHCLDRNPKHKLARAFQKLSTDCLLKFSHPELQAKPSRRKKETQTSFAFASISRDNAFFD